MKKIFAVVFIIFLNVILSAAVPPGARVTGITRQKMPDGRTVTTTKWHLAGRCPTPSTVVQPAPQPNVQLKRFWPGPGHASVPIRNAFPDAPILDDAPPYMPIPDTTATATATNAKPATKLAYEVVESVLSPNGKTTAEVRLYTNAVKEVWLKGFKAEKKITVGKSPVWAPDGESLFFRPPGTNFVAIYDIYNGIRSYYVTNASMISPTGDSATKARWTADGREVIFPEKGRLWSLAIK